MEFFSSQEAAAHWNISLRQVQRLLHDHRIPGAKKYGVSWFIPKNAERPMDLRRKRADYTTKQELATGYLTCGMICNMIPISRTSPEYQLMNIKDQKIRNQFQAELDYLKGNFVHIKNYYFSVDEKDVTYFCAANIAVVAAISTGDYELYDQIIKRLYKVKEKYNNNNEIERMIEQTEALVSTSLFIPQMAPEWLCSGDFSDFPDDSRLLLTYLRVKYYQGIHNFEAMLAVAQTTLSLIEKEETITLTEIYLISSCACACYGLKRFKEAEYYIHKAFQVGIPFGYLIPLAEIMMLVGGMLEPEMNQEYSEQFIKVKKMVESSLFHWLSFHNKFTKHRITLILNIREYQVAVLLNEGKSYSEIAGHMNLSVGRVKNVITSIYDKLNIHGRQELRDYIL